MEKYKKIICLVISICFVFTSIYGQSSSSSSSTSTEPVPYSQDEFPQWAKDLRRGEIILIGSIPFTVIGTTLGYGAYLYYTGQVSTFPNPLDKSSDSLTSQQEMQIVGISVSISGIFALTDFIFNVSKRNIQKSKSKTNNDKYEIIVESVSDEEVLLKRQKVEASDENSSQKDSSQTEE